MRGRKRGAGGEWAAESPALAHSSLLSAPGRRVLAARCGPGLQRRARRRRTDGRDALRLSTTGRRARTCGHSSSFPAVVHRLCSCCAAERAITTASHSYFLSLFTFRAGKKKKKTQAGDFQKLACTLTSPGQTIDDAAVRVPGSPKRSTAGFTVDRHRRGGDHFFR